jgi:hypothetical protein
MPQRWSRDGYQLDEIDREGRLFEQPERQPDALRFTLMDDYAQDAFKMRAIAA